MYDIYLSIYLLSTLVGTAVLYTCLFVQLSIQPIKHLMLLDVKNVEKHGASRSSNFAPYCASFKPVYRANLFLLLLLFFCFMGTGHFFDRNGSNMKKSVSFYIISISPNAHVLALLKKKNDSVYVSIFKAFIWITLKDINDLLIEFIDAISGMLKM